MLTKEEVKAEWEYKRTVQDIFFKLAQEQYPNLFGEMERINFDLPVGWVGLFRGLCNKLEESGVKCVQVKQKFGRFTMYVSNYNVKVPTSYSMMITASELIGHFAEVSQSVCEECGSCQGKLNTEEGYIQTLCPKCVKKRDDKWKN